MKYPSTIAEPSASVLVRKASSSSVPPACVTQLKDPEGSIFATKMSLSPVPVSVVSPKVAGPSKTPVTIVEPSASVLTPTPSSVLVVPPACVAHTKDPAALTFATKMSSPLPPVLVRVLEPKVAVPWKNPVKIADPSASVLTYHALSFEVPPALVAQTNEPEALIFATKTS